LPSPKFQDAQRCFWYQIAKVSPIESSPAYTTDGNQPYSQLSLSVTASLQALTPIAFGSPTYEPLHVNAALVSPYVVNVYARTFYIR
jgi:hypothetical protein